MDPHKHFLHEVGRYEATNSRYFSGSMGYQVPQFHPVTETTSLTDPSHKTGNIQYGYRNFESDNKQASDFSVFGDKQSPNISIRSYNPSIHNGKTEEVEKPVSNKAKRTSNEGIYPCRYCDKVCKYSGNLKLHMMTHTGEKPFKCNECDKAYRNRTNLNIHKRVHTGERPYKCGICNKGFLQHNHLTCHIKTHSREKVSKERPYLCNQCGKAYTTKSSLRTHMRIHTGDRPFQCDQCGKRFFINSQLIMHKMIHTGENPFNCNLCDIKFTAFYSLYKHINTIHNGEKQHQCKQCEKSFYAEFSLQKHIKIHSEENPNKCFHCGDKFASLYQLKRHRRSMHMHICTHCGKKFRTKEALEMHVPIHRTDTQNPFDCNQCDSAFATSYLLKEHKQTHKLIYKCNQCDKAFITKFTLERHKQNHIVHSCTYCGKICQSKSVLKVHMRIHTGEKPFKCNQCDEDFSSLAKHKIHMMIHTGEKPFYCKLCDKAFPYKSGLLNHNKVHHKYTSSQNKKDNLHTMNTVKKLCLENHDGGKKLQCNQCNNFSDNNCFFNDCYF